MRCKDLGFSSQSGIRWKVGGQFSAAYSVEPANNKGLVWVADACFGTVIAAKTHPTVAGAFMASSTP